MEFIRYDNARSFSADVMEFLLQNEVENNVTIGNIIRGLETGNSEGWFMAAVKDLGKVVLTAMMTPPFNFLISGVATAENFKAMDLIMKELMEKDVKVPGIVAEKPLAAAFSEKYCSDFHLPQKVGMKMRLYRLDTVLVVPQVTGKLRAAKKEDLFFLPHWQLAFADDCQLMRGNIMDVAERIKRQIEEGILFIWEDGGPVAQAAAGRKTLNGVIINAVYTPPYFRKKGYATSCVAEVSRLMLNRGYKFCALFTDLDNPISNSIYMKIGYKPVCDFDEIVFG